MKGFMNICRAATCASGVIPECCSRESVFIQKGNGNNGSPTKFLGDDNYNGNDRSRNPAGRQTLRDAGLTAPSHMPTTAGFTLIELLVVVLIIGILAAAALPSYRVAVGTSRVATMYAFMRAVDQAQQHFYMQTNRYATNFDSLVIALPSGFKRINSSRISNNDMSCYIMTMWGPSSISIKCEERKNAVTIEKYHKHTFYICWAARDKSLGNRICQNLSGRDSPSGTGSDGDTNYLYFMNN